MKKSEYKDKRKLQKKLMMKQKESQKKHLLCSAYALGTIIPLIHFAHRYAYEYA